MVALVLSVAMTTPGFTASLDFASLRKAAEEFAVREKPGFKLLTIHVTASNTRRSLQIHDSEFHYFGPVCSGWSETPPATLAPPRPAGRSRR
jgi:hypothetical protein